MQNDTMPQADTRRTVLITGGTDGLGRALAQHYLRAGWRVIVVARTAREVDGALFIAADLAAAHAHHEIAQALDAARVDRLDLIIHNAASGSFGPIEGGDPAVIERLISTNVWAPIALTHTLLPRLSGADAGIVLIGSVAAFAPAPSYAVYAASKAALDGFARSLSQELKGRVHVQVTHPGPIRTGFHARAGVAAIDATRYPAPERVASQVVRAIRRGGWRRFVDARSRAIGVGTSLFRVPLDGLLRARNRKSDRIGNRAIDAQRAQTVLVTGAASGLGAALSSLLIARGSRVVGVDRSLTPASSVAMSDRYEHIVCDLADGDDVGRLAAMLAGRHMPLASVFFCAGTSAVGAFAAQPLEPLRGVLRTNLIAPLLLTTQLLKGDMLAPNASIVLVSSLSHYVGYPGAAVYAASKDGLAHFGRCLSVAPIARGVHALTVFPGPMRTPHAVRYAPAGAPEANRLSPDVAAAALLRAVAGRKSRLVIGRGARLAMVVGIVAPTLASRIMRRTLYRQLVTNLPETQANARTD